VKKLRRPKIGRSAANDNREMAIANLDLNRKNWQLCLPDEEFKEVTDVSS
jgi:hypothetical protein